jgi:isocitrate dehydrogenase kinase/phosphatase
VASDATVQGRLQSTDPEIRALRDRVAAELAAFAKQSLIQGLYAQRGELLETQQRAREELDQLEARLAALHLPLQERIRAYETRIGELEKELETRSEEMRNLIHATLLLIRGRLEAEKAGEPGVGQLN